MNMKELEMKNKHFGISSVAFEHERISVFGTVWVGIEMMKASLVISLVCVDQFLFKPEASNWAK